MEDGTRRAVTRFAARGTMVPIEQVSQSCKVPDEKDGTQQDETPRWEKVLWKKQPFPDNYTPASFLSALQTNNNVYLPDTYTLINLSLPISIQFNMIMVFIGIFIHLLERHVSPVTLCLYSTIISASGWILCGVVVPATEKPQAPQNANSHCKTKPPQPSTRTKKRGPISKQVGKILSLLILSLVLFALSPVLRTLTESTTSDSIWALTATLLALNFALADYSTRSVPGNAFSPTGKQQNSAGKPTYIVAGKSTQAGGGLAAKVSFNAAVCASVVLASRLESNAEVFTLLLAGLQVFAFFPLFRARMIDILIERMGAKHDSLAIGKANGSADTSKTSQPKSQRRLHSVTLFQWACFTATFTSAIGLFLALEVSQPPGNMNSKRTPRQGVRTTIILHLLIVIFLSVLCPVWMRISQKKKRRLNGPWDPAVPIVRAADS